ncbi:MAG: hypothetical protein NTZ43_10970 [Gemmatimonadetes bacterium]|nr:hypothetical protein [Gemmatimonadota bacterium]
MKRMLLGCVVASCALAGVGYAGVIVATLTPVWAPWCLAMGANGAVMSLMALGASRRGTLAPALRWTFLTVFVLCAASFGAALAMPANEGAAAPLLLGFPVRTAILLYGVGVVPMFILPFAYALTFDASTLSDDDLARVRAAHRAQSHEERV